MTPNRLLPCRADKCPNGAFHPNGYCSLCCPAGLDPLGPDPRIDPEQMEFEEAHSCNCDQCVPKRDTDRAPEGERWPTLIAIGLGDALDAVEEIAAAHQSKHPGRKWITKTVAHHDAKSIKHLSTVQCGQPRDLDSGLPGRAHAALRMVMALALELLGGR